MNEKDKALLKEGIHDLFVQLAAFAIVGLLYGYVLMLIWNGTFIALFDSLPKINYWQSVSLFVFVRLLIGKVTD